MHVHAFILHFGGNLQKTLESLRDCDTIDVLTDYLASEEDISLVTQYDRFITSVYTDYDTDFTLDNEMNKLVDKTDSDYILTIYSGDTINNITDKLYKYRKNKKLAMIRANEKKLDKLIVDTRTWRWLCGIGKEQDIQTKVEIQATNEGHQDWILNSIEELDAVAEVDNAVENN